jgi:hypothetical protein
MAYGIPGVSPNLISQQQRISAMPSDPKETALAKYLIQLTQQNKVGTPEYFLAAGEFSNRQKVRQEQAAKQPQGPKVVENITAQAVQKAAPMMQGVGNLDAGSMERIDSTVYSASGGIVAFDDGGEVQRFQNQGMVSSSPFGRDVRAFGEAGRQAMLERTPGMVGAYGRPLVSAEEDERMRLIQALNQKYGPKGSLLQGYFMQQSPAERDQAKEIISRLPTMSLPELRALASYGPQATPVAQAVQTGGPMGGKQGTPADVRRADTAPAETPPYIPRSMQMSDVAAAPAAPSIASIFGQAEGIAKNLAGTAPQEITAKQGVKNVMDALKEAGFDPLFHQKQIEEIRKEKEQTKGDRREAINMRLIEAGLGILGGESPYAFVNIGKGASPALKGLQDDIKDIKKIDRERDKAIRDLQTAEQDVKKSTGIAGLKEVQDSRARVDKYNEMLTEAKGKVFTTIYGGEVQKQVASMPGVEERLIDRYMRDPRFAASSKEFYASRYPSASSRVDTAILQDYAKNPQKLEMLKDTNPELYNYIKAQLSALAIPSAISAPAGRPVRE